MAAGLAAQNSIVSSTHRSILGLSFVQVPGTLVWFATTETTVEDFQRFIDQSGHPWAYEPHFGQGPNHPAVGVRLQDAIAFCNWLTEHERRLGRLNDSQGYRLPTAAEWSAAAGVERVRQKDDLSTEQTMADQKRFPWGLNWPPPAEAANLAEGSIERFADSYPYTAPVGRGAASGDGLFDLAGNVWEWTADLEIDSGIQGHLRGGSWASFHPDTLKSAFVYEVPADLQAPTIGFRVVFEDQQRSATLLAAADQARRDELERRRTALLSGQDGELSPEALQAMRQRLAGSTNSAEPLPDPSSLKALIPGEPFSNSVGMIMLPVRTSTVQISDTEVTAQAYELFLEDSSRTWEKRPSHITSPRHPVAAVSWQDAVLFCEWLTRREREAALIPTGASYRLPSDVEWSAAAGLFDEVGANPMDRHLRVTDHFPWHSPHTWPPPSGKANLDAPNLEGFDDNFAYTCEVRGTEPNELGFYELAGNVAEWVSESWPDDAAARVVRGGSWLSSRREDLLTSARHRVLADQPRDNLGFRCALQLPDE